MKLAGWKKRIRLDIDYTNKIGGSVTQFPVTIFLKPTNGDTWKVFNEVGNNYRKIAITKADGVTELKVEMELWDVANKVGVLHTSLANWVIGGDTCIYLYYDGSHYDNPNVGNIASTAGQAVWDSNFKMVQHMNDYDTSHIKDSTSNNNDGTKKAINEPVEADGQIAKAQDFDGSDDYINLGRPASLNLTSAWTLEAWVKPTSSPNGSGIITEAFSGDNIVQYELGFGMNANRPLRLMTGFFHSGAWSLAEDSVDISTNQWIHIIGTWDGTTLRVYKNGALVGSNVPGRSSQAGSESFWIGRRHDTYTSASFFPGLIDEVRISNTGRSAAWIKASYNSGNNTLLKYLKEETLFSRRGIFYVPINTSNFFHFFK